MSARFISLVDENVARIARAHCMALLLYGCGDEEEGRAVTQPVACQMERICT